MDASVTVFDFQKKLEFADHQIHMATMEHEKALAEIEYKKNKLIAEYQTNIAVFSHEKRIVNIEYQKHLSLLHSSQKREQPEKAVIDEIVFTSSALGDIEPVSDYDIGDVGATGDTGPLPLNLYNYGLNWILHDSIPLPTNLQSLISTFHKSLIDKKELIIVNSDGTQKARYKVNYNNPLGFGGFSFVYECRDNRSKSRAIKIMKGKPVDSIQLNIYECMCQIILYNFTKSQPKGAFCPALFDIAYSNELQTFIIVSEKINMTMADYLTKHLRIKYTNWETIERASDVFILEKLKEICTMLDILQTNFMFLHQDLKPENIVLNEQNNICFIDFGFSYMRYSSHHTFGAKNNRNDLYNLCSILFAKKSVYSFSKEFKKKLWNDEYSTYSVDQLEKIFTPSAFLTLLLEKEKELKAPVEIKESVKPKSKGYTKPKVRN